MPTDHERFWTHSSYAVVGHQSEKPFPKLSYRELKKRGKQVFAIDASTAEIDGDRTYPDFAALPRGIDAAVLELPRSETAEWVLRAADAGIRRVWIHMSRDTPEAFAIAKDRGLELHTGTCAVMYLNRGFSAHTIHRWINQALRKY